MANVRYTPLGPLLSGKGSRAFLGLEIPEDNPLGARPVVLIWLPEDVVGDRDLVAAVQKETQRAAQLDHPHIINVRGFIRHEQGLARVVEYADGESLRRVLESTRKLPAPLAARVTADAAVGVHYAHMAGNDDGTPLVHGDLRPETLLISYSGICKVAGYGALAVAPKEAGGRRVRGRRQHCAPEQVLGGRSAVNVQTDVYLLGVVLYECLTGTVPFEGEADFDQAVLSAPVPDLPPEDCPPALLAVVKKAMSKKAQDRYPTALALREAIEQAMGELPTHQAFGTYLKDFFPEDYQARVVRKQLLDEGLEKLRQSGPQALPAAAPPSLPTPSAPTPASAPPSPPRPPPPPPDAVAPVPTSAPPVASPVPTSAPSVPPASAAPARQGRSLVWAVLVLLVLGAGASLWWLRRAPATADTTGPASSGPVAVVAPSDAGASSPAPVDSGVAATQGSPDASVTDAALALAPDASVPGGAVGSAADAGSGEPPGDEQRSMLSLIVEPAVNVTVGGKHLGRTPFTVPMPPGRHVLQLANRAKGISTTRVVVLTAGETASERIYLRRGYINVVAPSGSEVFVDGKKVGKAPLRELGLYEGSHKILVDVAGHQWRQSFDLKPDERSTFTVDFE